VTLQTIDIPDSRWKMKDSASEPTLQPTDSDKQVPQFSIGKLFAWTGVVAGGFTVVTASVSEGGHDLGIFVAVTSPHRIAPQ
jgi:hypothetical protein